MTVFGFRVILDGIDVMTDDIAESLYQSGCDDCSPFSSDGLAGAVFDREAPTLDAAVATALHDIRKAGYRVARVEIEAEDLAQFDVVPN
jgi:hypothetical protein